MFLAQDLFGALLVIQSTEQDPGSILKLDKPIALVERVRNTRETQRKHGRKRIVDDRVFEVVEVQPQNCMRRARGGQRSESDNHEDQKGLA